LHLSRVNSLHGVRCVVEQFADKIKGNQKFWHIQKTIDEFPSI